MPEAIDGAAEALARRLLQDLPARQPVARAAFARLPDPVASLLNARLDARVDREATLPVTPWIDRDHAAVRDAQAAWREAVRAAARVPADAWEDLLAEASRLAIAHLVQPAETLSGYAFADDPTVGVSPQADPEPLPTPLILERLRAFAPYPYLIEIVERYVEKKGLGHIDRDGLERLLLRIDSRMVAGFSADDWITLLNPLFDLLGSTVPGPLLELAFSARDQPLDGLPSEALTRDALHAHLAGLQAPSQSATTEKAPSEAPQTEPPGPTHENPSGLADPEVSAEAPDELATEPTPEPPPTERPTIAHSFQVQPPISPTAAPPIIGSKFNAPEEVAPDDSDILGPARPVEIVEPMEPMASLDPSPGTITDAVVTETLERTPASGDEPLWKRLAGSAEDAPPTPAPDTDKPLWARFSPDAPASPDASSAPAAPSPAPERPVSTPTTLADAHAASAPSPALRLDASLDALELAVFGASDTDRRAWYIEELFSGNATNYRDTLLQLDAARTWTEATDIIARDVFRKHSVNIYSDPAVTFTDAVEGTMEAR